MAVEIASGITWFAPIFAFLLVMLITYVILTKTELLKGNEGVAGIISFIVASFFMLESQLVDYVEFLTGWVGVLVVIVFFLFLLITFASKDFKLEILEKNNWFSWVFLAVIIGLFIFATSYTFDWVVNWAATWGRVNTWVVSDWFGFVLLLALGAAAYGFIKTKAGN
ncbi:hypothetical protein HN747_00050 [archaeon]|jgi:hypothetical protein|nr:hypothetical protein [archaeon]